MQSSQLLLVIRASLKKEEQKHTHWNHIRHTLHTISWSLKLLFRIFKSGHSALRKQSLTQIESATVAITPVLRPPLRYIHPRHNNNCISGLCACSLREGLVCQQTFREESDSRDHVCCPKSGALVPAGSLSDNGDITSRLRCPEHHYCLAGSPVASTF